MRGRQRPQIQSLLFFVFISLLLSEFAMQLNNPYTEKQIQEYRAADGVMILAMQAHFRLVYGDTKATQEADEKYSARSEYEFLIWKMLKFSETEWFLSRCKQNGMPDYVIKQLVGKVTHVEFVDDINSTHQLELDALAHNPNQ
jgi:hypothetical protein